MACLTATMFLSGLFRRITGWVGGASAPPSLSREERKTLMRKEVVAYYKTGIEPDFTPHDGRDDSNDKLLRCNNCGTLVWKRDKKEQRANHEGHRFVVAAGGTVEEAIALKYDLIRSEDGE